MSGAPASDGAMGLKSVSHALVRHGAKRVVKCLRSGGLRVWSCVGTRLRHGMLRGRGRERTEQNAKVASNRRCSCGMMRRLDATWLPGAGEARAAR